jgi:hypothetical protein
MLVGALSLCIMLARPRLQRAAGLPRAVFTQGGKRKTPGTSRREKAKLCLSAVIPGRRNVANYAAQLRT